MGGGKDIGKYLHEIMFLLLIMDLDYTLQVTTVVLRIEDQKNTGEEGGSAVFNVVERLEGTFSGKCQSPGWMVLQAHPATSS